MGHDGTESRSALLHHHAAGERQLELEQASWPGSAKASSASVVRLITESHTEIALHVMVRRLRNVVRSNRVADRDRSRMAFHSLSALMILMAAGMSPDAARDEARRASAITAAEGNTRERELFVRLTPCSPTCATPGAASARPPGLRAGRHLSLGWHRPTRNLHVDQRRHDQSRSHCQSDELCG